MCTVGFNHFSCGCSTPIPWTLQRCEWAKLKGRTCPDFQISEDPARSRVRRVLACMAHSS